MRNLLLTLLFVSAATMVLASDCDSLIVDRAHVLVGHEPQIANALAAIKDKGGDPRVITDNPSADTPEQYVHNVQRVCPSWQSADGGVKNNLIVFLVFPQRRKVGLFIGKEFESAIQTAQIRSEYMAPAFRDGDWARGFINGANQTAIQIEAHNTAALHPNTTVIDEKPTDLHGLWVFLDIFLGIIGLCLMGWAVVSFYRRRQKIKDAQQGAVQARNDAASRVRANPDTSDAEDFAKMSSSETWNPETEGLSAGQYDRIAARYNEIARRVVNPYRRSAGSAGSAAPAPEPPVSNAPQQSSYVDRSHTTIINSDPGYIPVPIIIDDGPRYESPRYEPVREPDPEPVTSSIFGGGGSDFGSRDDDGGGFSGGSSDEGGGGDGGSDGGSSDF